MGILNAVRAGIDIEVNSGGRRSAASSRPDNFNDEQRHGRSKWRSMPGSMPSRSTLYELSLIDDSAQRLGKRANVSLRLVPEIETDTHSGLQTALLTSKFGMMPTEAFAAFRKFKSSQHLDLRGIHLHIGSQNHDGSVYTEAFKMLFENLPLRKHRDC